MVYVSLVSNCITSSGTNSLRVATYDMSPGVVRTPATIDISAGYFRRLPVIWFSNTLQTFTATLSIIGLPPLYNSSIFISSFTGVAGQSLPDFVTVDDALANQLYTGSYILQVKMIDTTGGSAPPTTIVATSANFTLITAPAVTSSIAWSGCLAASNPQWPRFGVPVTAAAQKHTMGLRIGINPVPRGAYSANFTVLTNTQPDDAPVGTPYPTPDHASETMIRSGTYLTEFLYDLSLAPFFSTFPLWRLNAFQVLVPELSTDAPVSYYIQLYPQSAATVQCVQATWIVQIVAGMPVYDPVYYTKLFVIQMASQLQLPASMIRVTGVTLDTVAKLVTYNFLVCESGAAALADAVTYTKPYVTAVMATEMLQDALEANQFQGSILSHTNMTDLLWRIYQYTRCGCPIGQDCSGGRYERFGTDCPRVGSAYPPPAPNGVCANVPSPNGSPSSSNGAVIAGGVIGGVAGLGLIVAAVWYIRKRCLQRSGGVSYTYAVNEHSSGTGEPSYSILA